MINDKLWAAIDKLADEELEAVSGGDFCCSLCEPYCANCEHACP